MNEELIAKAREAKSPEELLKLAKEAGISDITEGNAGAYFELISSKGELSDDELSNAAGGCKRGGKRVVTAGYICQPQLKNQREIVYWRCKKCRKSARDCKCYPTIDGLFPGDSVSFHLNSIGVCNTCANAYYDTSVLLELCNNDERNAL